MAEYRKVWVLAYTNAEGQIRMETFGSVDEAQNRARELMNDGKKDGIKRKWAITTFYAKA